MQLLVPKRLESAFALTSQRGVMVSDHRHTDVCDFLYSLKVFVRSDYFVGTVCNSDPGY